MMIRHMIALFMLMGASGLMLSGCAPAAVGIGSAAIAAGTTEKDCPPRSGTLSYSPS